MHLDFEIDRTLVLRAVSHDQQAMRQIVERHQDYVYRLAYRLLGDVDMAQDITQDTFLKALGNLKRLQNGRALRHWLAQIATHLIQDYWKTQKTEVPFDEAEIAITHLDSDTEKHVESRDLREHIQSALMTLPLIYREAFVLKYVDEMNYQEMAETLEVGIDALKVRVHRACRMLRKQLSKFQNNE